LRMDYTKRNTAIDILRALTMLLMIFVNDLWTISGEPSWLGHAKNHQDFLGLADTVFPCFLFVVGMSIPFAIESRFKKGFSGVSTLGHILSRSLALLLMGVFIVNTEAGLADSVGVSLAVFRIAMVAAFILIWNLYPRTENLLRKRLYLGLKIAGGLLLLGLAIIFRDEQGGIFRAHWWGILGLIGWTYLVCAVIYLFARDRLRYIVPIWLGFVVLCMLESVRHSGTALLGLPAGNFFDELLGILHIGHGALPALTMGGILLSLISTRYEQWRLSRKMLLAAVAVVCLLLAGYASNKLWIVSKLQETPPWICYCSAIATAIYAMLYWLNEKGKAYYFNCIKAAGTATLTCYLMPYLTYSLSAILDFRLPEAWRVGMVGILTCLLFAGMNVGITYLLGHIHIKLKI